MEFELYLEKKYYLLFKINPIVQNLWERMREIVAKSRISYNNKICVLFKRGW